MFFTKEVKNLKIIILVIVACVVVGTALLIYSQKKPTPKKSELPTGIEVIETETGKIVRNTVEGYEVTVPKEWRAEIIDRGISGKNLRLRNEEIQQQIGPSEITRGCVFEIFVNKNPEKLTLNQWIELHAPGGVLSREDIKIGNHIPAIKIVGEELGSYIVVYTLNVRNNDIHELVVYPNEPNAAACIDNFNKILNTYSFE